MVRQLGSEKENEAAAMQAAKEEERKHLEEELSAIQAENARVQVGGHAPSPAQHRSIYAQTGTLEYGQKDCKLFQQDWPGCFAKPLSADCRVLVCEQHSNICNPLRRACLSKWCGSATSSRGFWMRQAPPATASPDSSACLLQRGKPPRMQRCSLIATVHWYMSN